MRETTGIFGQLERYCAGLGTIQPGSSPADIWERGRGSAADGAALMSRGFHAQVRKASSHEVREIKASQVEQIFRTQGDATQAGCFYFGNRQENRTSRFESIAGDCPVAFAIRRNA